MTQDPIGVDALYRVLRALWGVGPAPSAQPRTTAQLQQETTLSADMLDACLNLLAGAGLCGRVDGDTAWTIAFPATDAALRQEELSSAMEHLQPLVDLPALLHAQVPGAARRVCWNAWVTDDLLRSVGEQVETGGTGGTLMRLLTAEPLGTTPVLAPDKALAGQVHNSLTPDGWEVLSVPFYGARRDHPRSAHPRGHAGRRPALPHRCRTPQTSVPPTRCRQLDAARSPDAAPLTHVAAHINTGSSTRTSTSRPRSLVCVGWPALSMLAAVRKSIAGQELRSPQR